MIRRPRREWAAEVDGHRLLAVTSAAFSHQNRVAVALLGVLALGACSASALRNGATPPLNANAASALPANLRGVTYDDLSSTCSATKAQLHTERLLRDPTVRIVFDRVPPACYASGVARIDRYGQTMGELIDSSAMKAYSLPQVRARVSAYLTALAGSVDLWEIGNEVNGEWLSRVRCPGKAECRARARDVISKVQAMYEAAARAGYATEMTLYYEPPRVATQGYQMIPWEETYVPAAMHRGLRYVLVSYYETENEGIRPSHSQWDAIFKKLAADFPNAKVGFGEIGLPKPIRPATLARATNIFNYYQTLEFPEIPSYTRAGFWWNAAEDLVPSDRWPSFLSEVEEKL